jgi:hypothetical protein
MRDCASPKSSHKIDDMFVSTVEDLLSVTVAHNLAA